MEILLVRHTTPMVEKGVAYGQTDLDLAATYQEELARIIKELDGYNPKEIFASPLKRCKILAQDLKNTLNIQKDIEFDDRLKELNFGDWEMMKWEDMEKEQLDFWMEDFVSRQSLNGESFQQLSERVLNCFNEIKTKNSVKVLVVAHGGSIRCILNSILGLDLKNTFNLHLDFGGISKIQIEEGRGKVIFINR
ncbi:MAG: alpha-ribazole phosphatase [Flammeovirgaceae bacterium]|nr:alpha-ribazole phosphatase [Flammeovirgaceae bacterium]